MIGSTLRGRSLTLRVVGATAVVVALLLTAFAVFLNANERVRESELLVQRSTEAVSGAVELKARTVQLQNAVRALTLVDDGAFSADYREARRSLARGMDELQRAEEADGGRGGAEEEEDGEASIAVALEAIRAYSDRLAPLQLRAVRAGASQRREATLVREGRRRVRVAVGRLNFFVDEEGEEVAQRRAQARASAFRLEAVGAGALGSSVFLVILAALYMARSVIGPIRRVAEGARHLAAGDLSTRVPERATGEPKQLAEAFNAMAASLQLSDDRLREKHLELKRVFSRQHLILNSAGDGIYGLDRDGTIRFANPAAGQATGNEVDELLGRTAHDALHPRDEDGVPHDVEGCPITAALRDGQAHQVLEDVYERRDGTRFPVEYTATPIEEDGEVSGAVVVFKDITERREIDRMKDEFTSVVSHELRTPLTSIRGSLGLLAGGVLGPLPEKAQRMLDIAVSNTDRLVRLINDILDIERMESGRVTMQRQEIAVLEVMRGAMESVGAMAAGVGVRLEVEPIEARVWADPDRLTQMLTNLLSNAIKFSPPGATVSTTARRSGEEILFAVADEGRGIPEDKLETIFERFQQVDASDSRDKGGTGLGLAICRSIVEQHGGRIWAESAPDEGATFVVSLPALVEDEPPSSDNGTGPAVLVCDDDPSVRRVVAGLLAQRGYRTVPARSGAEAVELAARERPDVILLDLLMPDMSGWATAAALKERPETREIPIVVASVLPAEEGHPVPGTEERIEKPFDEASLFEALERALAVHGDVSKVLVVEDDLDLGRVLTEIFERRGLTVAHAQSGRAAIRESQRLEPDLLILDLGLPDGDGFSVVDWLREHERLGAVPIVVYTARDLTDAERARLGPDTDVFLKGALSPDEFAGRVLDLVGRLSPRLVEA